MNICELKRKLEESDISKDSYCLCGGTPNEAYCIEKKAIGWVTYYSERGEKNCKKVFFTEKKAADYFYKWVLEEVGRTND